MYKYFASYMILDNSGEIRRVANRSVAVNNIAKTMEGAMDIQNALIESEILPEGWHLLLIGFQLLEEV